MKYKVGVFGSGAGEMAEIMPKAKQLGEVLGKYAAKLIIVTGACSGLPYEVASEARKHGVEVWGFSPMFDLDGQKQNWPDDDFTIYDKLIYIPKDYPFAKDKRACMKYRNVISTATCDAGIIISGRWGSLNEFTNLVDMQKIVGVLTGTGGIADELEGLARKINKEGQGKIIFNDDSEALVTEVLAELEKAAV